MKRKYFAYNWLMNFDAVDFNLLLDFVEEHGLELRRTHIGNKFLRFVLAVDDEDHVQRFVSMIEEDVSNAEWHAVSSSEFERCIPVDHTKDDRAGTLTTFELMHKYTAETNAFYHQAYKPSQTNKLYCVQWEINKQGLDARVVEQAFDVALKYDNVWMASAWRHPERYISIFVIIAGDFPLPKLLAEMPDQIRDSLWILITPEQIPDSVSGHPYALNANIFAAWREGLYEWIRTSN